jgi:hypothetical protein
MKEMSHTDCLGKKVYIIKIIFVLFCRIFQTRPYRVVGKLRELDGKNHFANDGTIMLLEPVKWCK